MIEGTRSYRGKNAAKNPANEIASSEEEHRASLLPDTAPDAMIHENKVTEKSGAEMGRRAWFSALVPALGEGLVQILRASNNLKRDLRELSANANSEEKKDPSSN